MRDEILNLIKEKPRHYTVLIKKDQCMLDWIMKNTALDETYSFVEIVYSAVYGTNLICPSGNKTNVRRWNDGPVFCGHQSVCKCSRESTSSKVMTAKGKVSPEDVQKSNTKRRNTLKDKTGYEYNSQRPEIKEKLRESKLPESIRVKLVDVEWLKEQYVTQNKSALQISKEIGCFYGTVLDYCRKHGFDIQQCYNRSLVEIEIEQFIQSLGFEVEVNRQDLLNGKNEIDIYVPSKKFAIEVNGLYYHSQPKSSGYEPLVTKHLNKTISAVENGISLYHVTDWEWNNKRHIIKSQIKNKLGISNRIYARKCVIEKPTSKEQMKFFDDNHLMGGCSAKSTYGLKYDGEWVMMISLKSPRYRKSADYEIIRLSSMLNTTVVGGFSKLLKAIKGDLGSVTIESYCDRSKSNGAGYLSTGFEVIGYSDAGFFWTDTKDIISRYMVTRKTLERWCKTFDPDLSQSENMFANGYRRYWDCGNIVMSISL